MAKAQSGDQQPETRRCYASPPCYLHEIDPTYYGSLGRVEHVELLNDLLEGERVRMYRLEQIDQTADHSVLSCRLGAIARDSAHLCSMLTRHLVRLRARPNRSPESRCIKPRGSRSLIEVIELLNAGLLSVVRVLNAALPRINDDELRADLEEMRDVHARNHRTIHLLVASPDA